MGKPGNAPHYYTRSLGKDGRAVSVKVPTHLLLVAGLDAAPAVARTGAGSSSSKSAARLGGVVLDKAVVDDIKQEITVRRDWEGK